MFNCGTGSRDKTARQYYLSLELVPQGEKSRLLQTPDIWSGLEWSGVWQPCEVFYKDRLVLTLFAVSSLFVLIRHLLMSHWRERSERCIFSPDYGALIVMRTAGMKTIIMLLLFGSSSVLIVPFLWCLLTWNLMLWSDWRLVVTFLGHSGNWSLTQTQQRDDVFSNSSL